ncbi:MAG: DUF1513 domain-containing protein [Sulfitobacter sp.]
MTTRRSFLASVLVSASLPAISWADAGGPSYLAAAREVDGTFALFGLTATGQETFRIALPARAHAGAAHPHRPEAIVFARRPGTFGLIIECLSGQVVQDLTAPKGQHFSGHGVFSADGNTLFTGEIDNLTGAGGIGLWSRGNGYRRIGAFASGGIGPHEIVRLPGQDVLVVANGGIITDLDEGRTKLNIDTMQPNLSYLSLSGDLLDQVIMPPEMRKASIRHLSVNDSGKVAFAMQWEGVPDETPSLIGLHRMGQDVHLLEVAPVLAQKMKGYIGSIAFSGGTGAGMLAASCPKGSVIALFDASGSFRAMLDRPDVCGLGSVSGPFFATDGFGGIATVSEDGIAPLRATEKAWDNHLITI